MRDEPPALPIPPSDIIKFERGTIAAFLIKYHATFPEKLTTVSPLSKWFTVEAMPMPRRKRILCVEDHPETCELIQALMFEYEVISAHTLADGLRRATGEHFDLYLLDYHLPDGTGLELCSRIRAFNRKTPILIYSGTNLITEQEVMAAGARGFIEKKGPQFIDRLEGAIHRLLRAR